MSRLILLAFLLWPLIEIAVFIKIGSTIGVMATIVLVIVTGIVGGLVIRQLGVQLFSQMRSTMGRGLLPARSVADLMLIFVAGLLLLLPGFVTDALGLLLLLPPVREGIYGLLKTRMVVVGDIGNTGRYRQEGPKVIDLDDDDYQQLG